MALCWLSTGSLSPLPCPSLSPPPVSLTLYFSLSASLSISSSSLTLSRSLPSSSSSYFISPPLKIFFSLPSLLLVSPLNVAFPPLPFPQLPNTLLLISTRSSHSPAPTSQLTFLILLTYIYIYFCLFSSSSPRIALLYCSTFYPIHLQLHSIASILTKPARPIASWDFTTIKTRLPPRQSLSCCHRNIPHSLTL